MIIGTYPIHVYIERFANLPSLAKILLFLLTCVKDCIEHMATITALAKCFSSKFFCITKEAGLGKICIQRKFSPLHVHCIMCWVIFS